MFKTTVEEVYFVVTGNVPLLLPAGMTSCAGTEARG